MLCVVAVVSLLSDCVVWNVYSCSMYHHLVETRHQSQPSAISATPATQSDDPCHQVRRLPHKVKVDVTKCHACHAKRRGVPAGPGNQARHQSQPTAKSATPATQSDDPCVDKCHACHAKWRSMSSSATPATQSEGGCHKVPRLPRKTPRRLSAAWELSAPPEPTQCHKCHACHAKWRSMSPSATPAKPDMARRQHSMQLRTQH